MSSHGFLGMLIGLPAGLILLAQAIRLGDGSGIVLGTAYLAYGIWGYRFNKAARAGKLPSNYI